MKKLITGFIILFLAFNAFAQEELIIATGKFPPFISKNKSDSYLTEVLHAVAKEMGVKFKFRLMPWKRVDLSVENMTAWGAIPAVRTAKREKIFDFSDTLYTAKIKFFYYSPDGGKKNIKYSGLYSGLKDLKKYRIGGVRGYYYEQAFRDAGLKLSLVSNESQNVGKLFLGRIDLFAMNETTGWYLIKNSSSLGSENPLFSSEKIKNFDTLDKPLKEVSTFLMTSKKYPNTQKLLKKFNKALKNLNCAIM